MDFWDGGKGMIGREAWVGLKRRLDINTNIK
jgi:hypothetical protein